MRTEGRNAQIGDARKGQGMILIVALSLGGPGDAETGDRLIAWEGLVKGVGGGPVTCVVWVLFLTMVACFPYWVLQTLPLPFLSIRARSSHLI